MTRIAGKVTALAVLVGAGLFWLPAPKPRAQEPSAAQRKAIDVKIADLAKELRTLRKTFLKMGKEQLPEEILEDVEVYHQAAVRLVRHNEFLQPESADWALRLLDEGLQRAQDIAKGKLQWLLDTDRAVLHGYRSRLDDSVQPYIVTYPEGYGNGFGKKWRVDVVLHGRDATLTEVKFLHGRLAAKAAPQENFVRLDVYGRGNNGYRWAGETDLYEAMAAFLRVEAGIGRDDRLDMQRWVLRGFSMGGAGTWHLGLHRPSHWCVLGPGAGFTTTLGYVAKKLLPENLPPWQRACLRIFDAADYAENVFNVPVVAFSGAEDPQIAAARTIEERLKEAGLKVDFKHLIAPDLGHQFPLEWQKKAGEEYARHVAQGRPDYPKRVRFVTYTLRYPQCEWVRILGLEKHYEKALVDAEKNEDGFQVKTANVTTLRLTAPAGVLQDLTVKIDGQELTARPWGVRGTPHSVYLTRRDGKWVATMPQRLITEQAQRPRKGTGLHGPIDDAFLEAFLCVRGTGKPWHEATERYAEANLERFRREWSKYFRGELLVKDDSDVTAEDIEDRHLILFGDPSSNSLIGHILDGLPLKWNQEAITFGGKEYDAARHVPVLIYPSPLNATRYVVLNSGHTFHAPDFEGTNALLFPRLGDFAVLRLQPGADPLAVEVMTAGLFDEFWQVPRE